MALRKEEQHGFQVDEDANRAVGPGHDARRPSSFNPTRLDFGHYAGRTIEELAIRDPDYLHWLERHPSGVRYRAEIHRVFGAIPLSTDWDR